MRRPRLNRRASELNRFRDKTWDDARMMLTAGDVSRKMDQLAVKRVDPYWRTLHQIETEIYTARYLELVDEGKARTTRVLPRLNA